MIFSLLVTGAMLLNSVYFISRGLRGDNFRTFSISLSCIMRNPQSYYGLSSCQEITVKKSRDAFKVLYPQFKAFTLTASILIRVACVVRAVGSSWLKALRKGTSRCFQSIDVFHFHFG
jgi:hypothetical protein